MSSGTARMLMIQLLRTVADPQRRATSTAAPDSAATLSCELITNLLSIGGHRLVILLLDAKCLAGSAYKR